MEIDESDKNFETIYEHRKGAKDRSIASLTSSAYFAQNPMNDSSFQGLIIGSGQSQLLYSKSSERDKAALEEFQMISVVGRGTFGKVFLVYLPVS